MSEHLSRDEMIQHLYGLDTGARHLADCPKCFSEYRALEARKADLAIPEEIPSDLLASQRRAVYSRMGERPRSLHAWVPALATAALLAVGVYVYQPIAHPTRKVVPAAQTEVGDAQLFSEAVSIEQTVEPRAVAPIHGLFQGDE
jgi:anti-sigma factor RsiW